MTNPFIDYEFLTTGAVTARTLPRRLIDVVNVKDYGPLADGTGALLSSRYGSLAEAQVDYPGVESLSDTIDWAACMQALSWNSIFCEVAEHVYSPAVRFTELTWATGTATAVTGKPHGLTTGDVIVHHFTFQTDGAEWAGQHTVTVTDANTFTYPIGQPGPAVVPHGCFSAKITDATRASNVVTVNFGAPHRMISGIAVGMYGFPEDIDSTTNSRTITVTSPTQLTFPHTGSNGSLSLHVYAWLGQVSTFEVVSWPGLPEYYPSAVYAYYMSQTYPINYAGNYFSQIAALVTGTTVTCGGPFFWDELEAGQIVRFASSQYGKVWFPPGDYVISQQLNLQDDGVVGIFQGTPGSSIIRGSFPDYLMTQNRLGGGDSLWEGLTFINDDPDGGGLRVVSSCTLIRACTFQCDGTGLSASNEDSRNAVAFGVQVVGCIFLGNGTTSCGMADSSNNSEVCGNYFYNHLAGIRSQNFFHCTDGNSFVDCVTGFYGGMNPQGLDSFTVSAEMRGNAFINCERGLYTGNVGGHRIQGTYIEGGADAEYGLRIVGLGSSLVRGLYATGDFAEAAILPERTGTLPHSYQRVTLRSVGAENSGAGDAWGPLTMNGLLTLDNCNILPVHTYSALNGRAIDGLSYSSGTVTLTTDSVHYLAGYHILVSGVKVSGSLNNSYNGIYLPITQTDGTSTVTYAVNVPPGTADAGTGSIVSAGTGTQGVAIKAIDWDAGVVSVETLGPHGIPNYTSATMFVSVSSGFSNDYNGYFVMTVIDDFNFTYEVVSDPGTVDSGSLSPSYPAFPGAGPHSYVVPDIFKYNLSNDCEEGHSTGNISDGQKFGGGTAAIGEIVTGGGSQHISVIWTRNGWMRRG